MRQTVHIPAFLNPSRRGWDVRAALELRRDSRLVAITPTVSLFLHRERDWGPGGGWHFTLILAWLCFSLQIERLP